MDAETKDREEMKDMAAQALKQIADLNRKAYADGFHEGYKAGFELGVASMSEKN